MAFLLCGCYRREAPIPAAAAPTAPPKIVYVLVTPLPAPLEPEPAWTPEPEMAQANVQTDVVELAVPTPRPTIDIAAIPNQDRPRGPTPAWRTGQLNQCLSFTAEPMSQPGYFGAMRTRVRIRARNSCNSFVTADESWFELVSISAANGSPIGREIGRFQLPIPPQSRDSETMMEIDCPHNLPGGCRFTASVWWAAGGGRRPQ